MYFLTYLYRMQNFIQNRYALIQQHRKVLHRPLSGLCSLGALMRGEVPTSGETHGRRPCIVVGSGGVASFRIGVRGVTQEIFENVVRRPISTHTKVEKLA